MQSCVTKSRKSLNRVSQYRGMTVSFVGVSNPFLPLPWSAHGPQSGAMVYRSMGGEVNEIQTEIPNFCGRTN